MPKDKWQGQASPGLDPPTRRNVLLGGFCLCCRPQSLRASESGPLAVEEVAGGLHIRRGLDEEASPANDNALANIGFIVGKESVLVTDPGGSRTDGERLRSAIAHVTQLPVKYVVMSHVHPDHIFGAGAFLPDHPIFIGHWRLAEMLRQRGPYYRDQLSALLGAERAGHIAEPTLAIRDKAELDLGDRQIQLTAHEPAHTLCDLSLFDKNTGTLLPADLLFVSRIPSLDGSLRGWLKTLETLGKIKAARAVPGHGPSRVDWPFASTALTRYLETLAEDARAAIAQGISLEAAILTIAASEAQEWKLFEDYNPRNAAEAYRELEWE
ncbi:MAG TPA: quinoprotein relay system zinc metallohydrolase 2 [Methylocella sp.]|nr:quinoprotein relay system zinc metallohydrolase 2 [Methylocella sp.]